MGLPGDIPRQRDEAGLPCHPAPVYDLSMTPTRPKDDPMTEPPAAAPNCDVIISHVMLPQDANPSGNVHGGVIMKEIDSAAGVVAARHARCNIVTASIDRLDFHHPVFVGELLTLRARLDLVGRTSMDLTVEAAAENLRTGEIRHVASAHLTFVALDDAGQPTNVPPLAKTATADQQRHAAAEARRNTRLAATGKTSADTTDPLLADITESGRNPDGTAG